MDDDSQEEQRQAPRVAHQFIARYRPVTGNTGWLMSPLRDLSSGGARFLSEHPFLAGETVEMQLILPTSSQPVLLRARVAWAKPAKLGTVELGVAFDPEDTGVQRAIDKAVVYLLTKGRRD